MKARLPVLDPAMSEPRKDTPMMKCGHAANAKDGKGQPVCVICIVIGPHPDDARTIQETTPDLTGRIALCSYSGCREQRGRNGYNGRKSQPDYGAFGESGRSEAPSSSKLPFFRHHPDKPNDAYYCGCFGWE